MDHKTKPIWIGSPGKFDLTFGIRKYQHPQLMEPLYVIVWLDTDERVVSAGSWLDPISLENHVKANRQLWIDREFERIFLGG